MGAKKEKVKLTCQHCGCEFERLECQLGRGRGKFCSKKCCNDAQFFGSEITCALCGKKVYRHFSEQDIGVKIKQFCSRNCYMKWRKEKLKEKTYPKIGAEHIHRIVIEKSLGRKLLSSEIVHHVDGNKHNNTLENLIVMNQAEHARLHFTKEVKKTSKRGSKHENGKSRIVQ